VRRVVDAMGFHRPARSPRRQLLGRGRRRRPARPLLALYFPERSRPGRPSTEERLLQHAAHTLRLASGCTAGVEIDGSLHPLRASGYMPRAAPAGNARPGGLMATPVACGPGGWC
jgi:hypothetical protein